MNQLHLSSSTTRFDHPTDAWEKAGNAFLFFSHYSLWGRVCKIDEKGLHKEKINIVAQIIATLFAICTFPLIYIGYKLLKQSTTYQPALARSQLTHKNINDLTRKKNEKEIYKVIQHGLTWLSPKELMQDPSWLHVGSAPNIFIDLLKDDPKKLQEFVRLCPKNLLAFLVPLCPKDSVFFFLNAIQHDEAKLTEVIDIVIQFFGDHRNVHGHGRQETCEAFLSQIAERGRESLIVRRLQERPPKAELLYALSNFEKLPKVQRKAKSLLSEEDIARIELSEHEISDILGDADEVQRRSLHGAEHLPPKELVYLYPRHGKHLKSLMIFLNKHPEKVEPLVKECASNRNQTDELLSMSLLFPLFVTTEQAHAFIDACNEFQIDNGIDGIFSVFGDLRMSSYQHMYEDVLKYIASKHGWDRIHRRSLERSVPSGCLRPIQKFLEDNAALSLL